MSFMQDCAAKQEHGKSVEHLVLLRYHPDLAKPDIDGDTALGKAIEFGHFSLQKMLVDASRGTHLAVD